MRARGARGRLRGGGLRCQGHRRAGDEEVERHKEEIRAGQERETRASAAIAGLRADLEREVRERDRERREGRREALARDKQAAAQIASWRRAAERRAAIAEALRSSATLRLRDRVHRIPALRAAARVVVRWIAGRHARLPARPG
jgi:hypothetical protein